MHGWAHDHVLYNHNLAITNRTKSDAVQDHRFTVQGKHRYGTIGMPYRTIISMPYRTIGTPYMEIIDNPTIYPTTHSYTGITP
jgi:hypothetical protein